MVENSTFEFEDGQKYIIVAKGNVNNQNYVYLVNENDENDCFFRRIKEDGENINTMALESEEECEMVMNYFDQKFKDMLENEK